MGRVYRALVTRSIAMTVKGLLVLDPRITKLYTLLQSDTLKRLAAFRIDAQLLEGLETVWERDGVRPAEQVRRAIRRWLASKGVLKAERKRASTRKRP